MNEKQRDLLADITSKEQFIDIVRKHNIMVPNIVPMTPELSTAMYQATGVDQFWSNDTIWTLQRDVVREQAQVYAKPTAVLNYLRSFKHIYQLFPHVCRVDPTRIAYTPDMEAGLRDKKVTILMGRFIRKFFPLFTDNTVRELEAAHRAEMDPTLEIVTSREDVEFAYRNMAGDTACMRYGPNHFGHKEFHPSAIYASQHFGVAVHRDGKGTVKSRAVVWVNPDDPEDKRFVRIYGDAALQTKLERAGYKMRGLKGAKIEALRDPAWADDPDEQDRFVMPYLDPAGGIHYSGPKEVEFDGRWAVRYEDDPDHIHIVGLNERKKLHALDIMTTDCTSQSGSVRIALSQRGQIMVTCAVTGQTFSRLDHEALHWFNADGTLGWVKRNVVTTSHECRSLGLGQSMFQVYGLPESFQGRCLPGSYSYMMDTPDTLRLNRLVRLDPTYYPADQSIYVQTDCTRITDESWVKTKDAYQVQEQVDGRVDSRFVHKDDVKLLKKMGYQSVHPTGGMKLLVHASDTRLVETVGGKKAVKGLHELSVLWDGRWEFTRNVETTYIGGFSVPVRKGDPMHRRNAVVPDHMMAARIFLAGDEGHSTLTHAEVKRQFLRYFGRFLHKPNDAIVDAQYHRNDVTVETVVAAARDIVEMPQTDIDNLHYSNATLGWAHSVLRCLDMNERQRLGEIEIAEARAVSDLSEEYEDYLPPTPAQVVQDQSDDELLAELERVISQPVREFMHPPRPVVERVRETIAQRAQGGWGQIEDEIPF